MLEDEDLKVDVGEEEKGTETDVSTSLNVSGDADEDKVGHPRFQVVMKRNLKS